LNNTQSPDNLISHPYSGLSNILAEICRNFQEYSKRKP
jgi:hypothetical protein